MPALHAAAAAALPLAVFLTSAIWLARLAQAAGLAERLAGSLARLARGHAGALFALVCLLCALLTATVSLDGAAVLMVPLVLALTESDPRLRRTLLFATIAVVNAFSLAVPQGNPTNLVVMARSGLTPAQFTAHLFVPALAATAVCVAAVAVTQRACLRAGYGGAPGRPAGTLSAQERLAAAALLAAAVAGAAGPWFGVAPNWGIAAVAAVAFAIGSRLRAAQPAPQVPWRITAQIAALVAAFEALTRGLHPHPSTTLLSIVALALGAGAVASIVNNLPASVVLAGIAGGAGLPAYAALTGLSVGALATPHGSVATMLVRDGAPRASTAGYLPLWLPATLLATTAAAVALWCIG